MSLFESITKAKLKDCIANDKLTFIVQEGNAAKAIGKKGVNVRMLENVIKKKIRIIEFNNNAVDFIKNLTYPIDIKDIKQENGIVTITAEDTESRGILIGRDRHNLDMMKSIVKRYFNVADIKVN